MIVLIYWCSLSSGDCTDLLNPHGAAWSRSFKDQLHEQYEKWPRSGENTSTSTGCTRTISKTALCDLVLKAWEGVTSDTIIESFQRCGLLPESAIDDIRCFSDGQPAAEGREKLREALEAARTADFTETQITYVKAVGEVDYHDSPILGESCSISPGKVPSPCTRELSVVDVCQ